MRHYLVLIIASTLLISLLAPAAYAKSTHLLVEIDNKIPGVTLKTFLLNPPHKRHQYNIQPPNPFLFSRESMNSRGNYKIYDKTTAVGWYGWNYTPYNWALQIYVGDKWLCTYAIHLEARVWTLFQLETTNASIKITPGSNPSANPYICKLVGSARLKDHSEFWIGIIVAKKGMKYGMPK